MTDTVVSFRQDFYLRNIGSNFDLNAPGIYEWRVEGLGVYVGKALKLRSRINAYPNNVRRMLENIPWHGNPKKEYRRIHKVLRHAHDDGIAVLVTVLENCEKETRAERELFWIAQRRAEEANGGLPVLNA